MIINDILKQTENFKGKALTEDDRGDRQSCQFISNVPDEIPVCENEPHVPEMEFKSPENHDKVIPLYAPDDAVVKVFMMHSSNKSVLANSPFATGFQRQVIF